MTDKITLGDVSSFQNDTTATVIVNSNSSIIQTAFDNTLSRDGTAPNQMEASLDMNSNQILNLPIPATADSPARLQDLSTVSGGGTVSNIPAGGTVNQLLTKTGTADYVYGWSNLANNLVTNANLTQAPANTLKGNPQTVTANEADFTLTSLANKVSPSSTDLVMISDSTGAGALKTATVSSLATASGISSIDTLTGIFTTSNGITSTGNSIQMTPARRTLPTRQVFTSGSGTYTTPANCIYLKVTLVGGGGGGSTSNNGNNGAAGTASTFSTFTASAGAGAGVGASVSGGGSGGTASGGSLNITGGTGSSAFNAGISALGGLGGGSALLGGAGTGNPSNPGFNGTVNTGGGGAGGSSTGSQGVGAGGGGGGSCVGWINSPTSTYSYTVGAGGNGGNTGIGNNGGSGAAGIIIVEEFYNS